MAWAHVSTLARRGRSRSPCRGLCGWPSAGPAPSHPALTPDPERFEAAFAEFSERMAGNYPFHHPRYAGQMLKPPHPVAIAAYTAAMQINPNNHALDGGPATSALEVEVVRDLARDVRLPGRRARPPDVVRDDRQPRGAVGGARAAPGQGDRLRRRTPTTRTRGCAPCSASRARGAATRRAIDLEPSRPRAAAAASARSSSPPGTTGLGAVDRVERGASRCASATACACTSTPPTAASSRCSPSSETRSSRGPVPRDRATATASSSTRTSTASSPTAAARCSSATPRVGRLYKHDSPYTYFTSRRAAPRRDQPGVLARRRRRRGALADAALARPRADPGRAARGAAPRLGGRCCATPTCCACTSSRSSTSSPTSRPRRALSEIDAASARVLDAGHDRPDDPVFLSDPADRREALRRRAPGRRAGRRRRPRPAQRADEARARAARALAPRDA